MCSACSSHVLLNFICGCYYSICHLTMCSACSNHTIKVWKIIDNDFKYGRCYQSNLNATWQNYANNAAPLWMASNLKRWHLFIPSQLNLTKWRISSKLCFPSRSDQLTQYIKLLRNHRPIPSPSNKSSKIFPSPLYVSRMSQFFCFSTFLPANSWNPLLSIYATIPRHWQQPPPLLPSSL